MTLSKIVDTDVKSIFNNLSPFDCVLFLEDEAIKPTPAWVSTERDLDHYWSPKELIVVGRPTGNDDGTVTLKVAYATGGAPFQVTWKLDLIRRASPDTLIDAFAAIVGGIFSGNGHCRMAEPVDQTSIQPSEGVMSEHAGELPEMHVSSHLMVETDYILWNLYLKHQFGNERANPFFPIKNPIVGLPPAGNKVLLDVAAALYPHSEREAAFNRYEMMTAFMAGKYDVLSVRDLVSFKTAVAIGNPGVCGNGNVLLALLKKYNIVEAFKAITEK